MNLPNVLTLFRILAAFVFLYYALCGDWAVAFPIFCAAAFTDLVDGSIARLLSQRTRLGAFLDPMADKLLMLFGFLTLTLSHYVPLFLTILIIGRDLMIVLGLLFLKLKKVPLVYKPTYLSKCTTLFQILTVFSALFLTRGVPYLEKTASGHFFLEALPSLMIMTAILTVTTAIQYSFIGWRMLHAKTQNYC